MTGWMARLLPVIDTLASPLVLVCAWLLGTIRRIGVQRLPRCKRALLRAGVFPIRNHYFEPQFDFGKRPSSLASERSLPGIEWNVDEQLALLESLSFADEFSSIPLRSSGALQFHFNNGSFESGDAEFWYQLLRLKKPRRVFEVGSGYSTLIALEAIRRNQEDNESYRCDIMCIEPYEVEWLERTEATVIRKTVEEVGIDRFAELEENDFLFIDSSHVIRPQGDVLYEYLEIVPSLNPGVIVQVHDIFSPRNYLDTWLVDEVRFWNEQYLLEAFLTQNESWAIIAALNYLHHNHYERLKRVAPFLTSDREPGSFYMQKRM